MRAAIYARVSSERQEKEHTIGSQLEALRTYAAKNGMEIVEEFTDEGYSGARLDRRVVVRDDTEHTVQCDVGHPLDPTDVPSPARGSLSAKRWEHPCGPDDPANPDRRSGIVRTLHRCERSGR